MCPRKLSKIPIGEYLGNGETISEQLENVNVVPVYRLMVYPDFSPIDVNIQFILEEGWGDADRLRFWTDMGADVNWDQPLALVLSPIFKPSLIIRRYVQREDVLLHVHISQEGEIEILCNDRDFARRYLRGLFLGCPPSFHTEEELWIHEEWSKDPQVYAMFLGMLHSARGWASH